MSSIKNIKARQILDSRGNPTVEADVITEDGLFRASVPSGASTGAHEALELRDGDTSYYGGKGVLKAVANINEKIAPALVGDDPTDQEAIDQKMIDLDGTDNKSNLGANAILAVSLATSRAGAAAKKIPLYQHLSELGENSRLVLPVPMVLVLEGGKHADQSSDLQEFMVVPHGAKSFAEAIRWGSEIYHAIGNLLKKQSFNVNVGFEGAYGPSLGSNEKVLEIIIDGITAAGYTPGEQVSIAIDAAASEFFENGQYHLAADGQTHDSNGLIEFYEELIGKYPIVSIEDGLAEDDWGGWTSLLAKIGDRVQIVGDDLTVTNCERLQKAIDAKAINSILIKPNQIGTVTETLKAISLAKQNRLTSVVSHRSAETSDTFIADLVVGLGTGQSKFGATARSERTAKYNKLLRIEEELGNKASFAGKNAFKFGV